MIRLFVCDIDGCLAEPYQHFYLTGLAELADAADAAGGIGDDNGRPAVSICSGRAYAYVEAMTQALGLTAPVLFESGGGLFDPAAARTHWHPAFTDAFAEQLGRVKQWMQSDLLPGTAMSLDHGKRIQVGVVGPQEQEIVEATPAVRRFVEEHAPDLRVFATAISIDVLPPGITKKQGLAWLAERTDLSLAEIAYIGDSGGDIEALGSVGLPLAPANADEPVRAAVRDAGGIVTEGRVLGGTLEGYRRCVERNRNLDEREQAKEAPAA